MTVLDANLSVPFAIARQPFRYVTTLHGQYTGNTLYYIDELTIGSRYTVRGFDGETMLAASRGFYWRNELQAPIGQSGQAIYVGLDYGRVWGPQPIVLVGTQLAGAVIGQGQRRDTPRRLRLRPVRWHAGLQAVRLPDRADHGRFPGDGAVLI